MSSLFWSKHYEPQQTFRYSLWRSCSFLCLSMICNTHSEQWELCTQNEKKGGSRRKIHLKNDTYEKWWDGRQRFFLLLIYKTKKMRFWLCLFTLLFLELSRVFPIPPWHVTQTFWVFFMNRWCLLLQKSSFEMQRINSPTITLNNLKKKSHDSGSPHHCCGAIWSLLYSLYNTEHSLGEKVRKHLLKNCLQIRTCAKNRRIFSKTSRDDPEHESEHEYCR